MVIVQWCLCVLLHWQMVVAVLQTVTHGGLCKCLVVCLQEEEVKWWWHEILMAVPVMVVVV